MTVRRRSIPLPALTWFGLLLEAWLLARLLGGLTNYRVTAARGITWYWHFVNLMALFVVGTQLSPSA